jgi:hypothetical protein
MNSKNTWLWFAVAAMLAAFIFIFQHYFRAPTSVPNAILPNLQPQSVTSVQIIPNGALEIRADYTNNAWLLTKPIFYPAQPAAIETLLAALQKMTPATKISAAEMRGHKNAETEFGFDNPQISLAIEAGEERRQILVGNKTAPGDQVFLRVIGVDGAFVVDADWLKLIPHSVADWRSTALVDAAQNDFDSIIVTNGAKVIELHRDATNRLWRMTRPLQARADSGRITAALLQLQAARVTRFVTDDPKADLTAFGLQPADLDLWFGRDGNLVAAVHVGKNPPDDSAQVFAKREDWNAIVTTPDAPFASWRGAVNDFRDPYLFELTATAPVAEIEMRGENNFTLQRQGSNDWRVANEKFPADADSVQQFIKILAGLRVSEFVKDVVTTPDLEAYGLSPKPARQIILRSAIGDSNSVIAQLSFAATTNGIFVHREGEDFIYSSAADDFNNWKLLYGEDWQFRDRRIWNFTESDVAQITLRQNGKTRVMIRSGVNQWSLAAGSQGMINPPAIEESAHRLGDLSAYAWFGRNITEPEKFGWNTNNLQITVELKNGSKSTVDFLKDLPQGNTALAAVTLDGERWAFIFPPVVYQFVLNYLTIPANVP